MWWLCQNSPNRKLQPRPSMCASLVWDSSREIMTAEFSCVAQSQDCCLKLSKFMYRDEGIYKPSSLRYSTFYYYTFHNTDLQPQKVAR